RCLVFRRGEQVLLQSRAGQPLGRYFPEMLAAFRALPESSFVLDGEIVIALDGSLSFDDLLQRIHPAESRVKKLASETPATFLAFDLLVDGAGASLIGCPLSERRAALERFFAGVPENPRVRLSPATRDEALARRWMIDLPASGLEGGGAQLLAQPHPPGHRHPTRQNHAIPEADSGPGGVPD